MVNMAQARKTHPVIYALASALLMASSFTFADAKEASGPTQVGTLNMLSASLTLDVSGLETRNGQLMVALFDSEANYEAEIPLKGKIIQVSDDTVRVTFKHLRTGNYAFKLFHDANSNGKLDTNVWGIPSEDYYFSNDASNAFSAPEWGEAVFRLSHGPVTKAIDMT